uniref:corticotropin-releasing factor receptor 2 n=1 Tax=Panthera onca TaxID=9690 RepID=UPI0029550AD4|nr:corticotropin-releasing factor receptor 2 [Panthera onca]
MGGPKGPPRLVHAGHPLLCLLCLLPPLLKAAGPSQAPIDQPLWAMLEQYCRAVMTLANLAGKPTAATLGQTPRENGEPQADVRGGPGAPTSPHTAPDTQVSHVPELTCNLSHQPGGTQPSQYLSPSAQPESTSPSQGPPSASASLVGKKAQTLFAVGYHRIIGSLVQTGHETKDQRWQSCSAHLWHVDETRDASCMCDCFAFTKCSFQSLGPRGGQRSSWPTPSDCLNEELLSKRGRHLKEGKAVIMGAFGRPGPLCGKRSGTLLEGPAPWWLASFVGNAYRECLENGTWASRINYSQCEPILDDKQRKYDIHYHVALVVNYLGHCVSVAALVAAFLLFLALRGPEASGQECGEVPGHQPVAGLQDAKGELSDPAMAATGGNVAPERDLRVFNTVSTRRLRRAPVAHLGPGPRRPLTATCPVQVWCRCITTIFNYFVVTNFFWMFVEGCYLHTAIVMTYSTERLRKWLFLFIGWCIPCPIIIAWAIGKLYYENEQCWFGKEPGDLVDYIYQGPIILVLLINFVFLFNIVRILMTKLRASTTSETIQYRKAVKATLVLLPLLGITYMLFFINPGEDDLSQIVFVYFNSFLQSFQGFFVSVFYCFFNGEVRSAVRKRWHRWQDHHSLRVPVARATSIPTSPTRISFHSIKQTAAV